MEEKDNLNVDNTVDINEEIENLESENLSDASKSQATTDESEKLAIELQEQKDKYLRQVAEFDNFRRRTAKEKVELIQTASKDVITSLLDILDDCDRAEKQMQITDDIEQVKTGTSLVFNKLKNLLQQKGLQVMNSLHEDFDVEKHEAITEIEAGENLVGKVVDELQKGYYLNDKLIRFAKVVVGK